MLGKDYGGDYGNSLLNALFSARLTATTIHNGIVTSMNWATSGATKFTANASAAASGNSGDTISIHAWLGIIFLHEPNRLCCPRADLDPPGASRAPLVFGEGEYADRAPGPRARE